MELASSDSDHFHFLSFFSPDRLLDLILDHTSPLKDLLVPKRLLTSQQTWDRQPVLSSVSVLCPMHLSHQDNCNTIMTTDSILLAI
jgi:hypothetical protein